MIRKTENGCIAFAAIMMLTIIGSGKYILVNESLHFK